MFVVILIAAVISNYKKVYRRKSGRQAAKLLNSSLKDSQFNNTRSWRRNHKHFVKPKNLIHDESNGVECGKVIFYFCYY